LQGNRRDSRSLRKLPGQKAHPGQQQALLLVVHRHRAKHLDATKTRPPYEDEGNKATVYGFIGPNIEFDKSIRKKGGTDGKGKKPVGVFGAIRDTRTRDILDTGDEIVNNRVRN